MRLSEILAAIARGLLGLLLLPLRLFDWATSSPPDPYDVAADAHRAAEKREVEATLERAADHVPRTELARRFVGGEPGLEDHVARLPKKVAAMLILARARGVDLTRVGDRDLVAHVHGTWKARGLRPLVDMAAVERAVADVEGCDPAPAFAM